MPKNPPGDMPRIVPYLLYEDVGAALEWLANAFGFRERLRQAGPDARVVHAEMELAGGVILMGNPGPPYESPKRHGKVSLMLYVYVDDVEKHFEHAKTAGAGILTELEDADYGDRRYSAEDLEGHHWWFAQRTRDVAPGESR